MGKNDNGAENSKKPSKEAKKYLIIFFLKKGKKTKSKILQNRQKNSKKFKNGENKSREIEGIAKTTNKLQKKI